jgi:hypothetical protein
MNAAHTGYISVTPRYIGDTAAYIMACEFITLCYTLLIDNSIPARYSGHINISIIACYIDYVDTSIHNSCTGYINALMLTVLLAV